MHTHTDDININVICSQLYTIHVCNVFNLRCFTTKEKNMGENAFYYDTVSEKYKERIFRKH